MKMCETDSDNFKVKPYLVGVEECDVVQIQRN